MKADLSRTYVYAGERFGPGEDIEIPEGLAATLGLGDAPASDAAPDAGTQSTTPASEAPTNESGPPALSLVIEPPVIEPPVVE